MIRLHAACPAKVNLGLHVCGRRADGYHEIVTLFQAIDLWDEIEGSEASALSLDVSEPGVPDDEGNLVLRAARLLQERVPLAMGRGAHLHLRKAIPVGAGLGGGSSDAAGALLLLDALWELNLGRAALASLASELGSDVPFFLFGGTAVGTGRGEQIDPLSPIADRTLLLGSPPFPLKTPEVYHALGAPLTARKPDVTVRRLFGKFAEGNDFALVRNDLESPAFTMRVELKDFRDALSCAGAEVALLSGSGSTVFGMFRAGTDVMSIAESLRGDFPGWAFRASRTIASGVRVVPAVE